MAISRVSSRGPNGRPREGTLQSREFWSDSVFTVQFNTFAENFFLQMAKLCPGCSRDCYVWSCHRWMANQATPWQHFDIASGLHNASAQFAGILGPQVCSSVYARTSSLPSLERLYHSEKQCNSNLSRLAQSVYRPHFGCFCISRSQYVMLPLLVTYFEHWTDSNLVLHAWSHTKVHNFFCEVRSSTDTDQKGRLGR